MARTLTYGTDAELAAASSTSSTAHRKSERGAGRIFSPPCRKGPVMNWGQRLGPLSVALVLASTIAVLRGFQATLRACECA